MNYVDCNGDLYYRWNSVEIGTLTPDEISSWQQLESMDYQFTAESLETSHYDATASASPQTGVGTLTLQYSKAPVQIEGVKKVFLGESVDLKVKGGSLGIGASWIWRRDSCDGNVIGRGSPFRIAPTEMTNIFVRAEGKNNITGCAGTTIVIDQHSLAPVGITARDIICKGETTALNVNGGSLGMGAKWVWYTGGCGLQKLGSGSTISVKPTQVTTYYVRAEGDLNTTTCASQTVTVFGKSTDPTAISANNSSICEGETITLNVKGGSLAGDAEWQWYSAGCGGSMVGKGASISLIPISSTNYYVRAEGVCNNTNCVSAYLNVDRKISSLGSITVSPYSISNKGKKITLSIPNNNEFPAGSNLRWYKGTCTGKYIGSGSSVTVRTRSKTTYFVKAIGSCNESNCIQTTITPVSSHRKTRSYRDKNQILHWSFGTGLEWMQLQALAKYDSFGVNLPKESIRIIGLGVPVEAVFHPVFKEYFTLGLSCGLAYGLSPKTFTTPETSNLNVMPDEESLSYFRWNYGAEIALGFRKFKVLATLNRMSQNLEYEFLAQAGKNKYTFDERWNQEILGMGVRFGRYLKKGDKARGNLDFLYTISQQSLGNSPSFRYDNISERAQGFSFVYWKHNRYKLKTDLVVAVDDKFQSFGWDWNKAYIQASLLLSFDNFY
jgi:hypothetical protein